MRAISFHSCLQWLMQWSAELNSPIPIHFSSLIPKMLMFNLAISCLTTSKTWFMNLTFRVAVHYCSSRQRTLLSPLDTFTTACHFCFGPAAPFFLELLVIALQSSPVAYWMPELTRLIFQYHIFLPFHAIHAWSGLPFLPPIDHICQNSSLWLTHLGGTSRYGSASLSHTSPFAMTRLWFMKGAYESGIF